MVVARAVEGEAGGRDRNPWLHIPIGYAKTFNELFYRSLREYSLLSVETLRDGSADLETGVVGSATGPEVRMRALFRDRFVGVVAALIASLGAVIPVLVLAGLAALVWHRWRPRPALVTVKPRDAN